MIQNSPTQTLNSAVCTLEVTLTVCVPMESMLAETEYFVGSVIYSLVSLL